MVLRNTGPASCGTFFILDAIMQKTLIIFFSCLVFLSCDMTGKKQFSTASQYNNYIIDRQTFVINEIFAFNKAIGINIDSADTIREHAILVVDKAIADVKGMPPFRRDSAFRDAAVNSLTFYKDLFSDKYVAILALKRHTGEGNDNTAALDSINQLMVREEEGYDKALHNTQHDFADRNQMELVENKSVKRNR
jgi:hypothetical protein